MRAIMIAEDEKPNRHSLMRLLEEYWRQGRTVDSSVARRLTINPASAALHKIALLAHATKGDAKRGCSDLPWCPDRTSKRKPCIREDCEAT